MVRDAERGSGVDDTSGHDGDPGSTGDVGSTGDAGSTGDVGSTGDAGSTGGPASTAQRVGAADGPGARGARPVRRGGPASSARTAVVWEVLSAVLSEADPEGRGLDVVDAGGGSGGFAVPLAEAGHRVVVVDPSPDSLAALSRRAGDAGLADRVRAVQGDATDLPTLLAGLEGLDGGVDLVLCHSVLEVVDDPAAALAAVAAVLRPGGRLSLLAPNRAAAVLARALAGRPDEAAHVLSDPAGRWGPGDGTARRWDPAALAELIVRAGLVVEQVHGVRVVADLVPSAVLDVEPGAAAALLALERALSDRPPFRDLATQLHVLAVRPA
ncbi:MAG: putative metallothionein SmtA [Frankiales bacterium]|nr:putative metallothionein SmtA [Frankiales bacterium]